MKRSTAREVKQIILLLSTAVLCAGLLALFMLYLYGPTGRYRAADTILAPAMISQIHLQDKHPQTGQNVRFVFDKTEFSYLDVKRGQMLQYGVPASVYEQFYRLVSSEKSLREVKEELIEQFNQPHPTLLTTTLRTEVAGDASLKRVFQVIQFLKDDYFRVQLHGGQKNEWAYFHQPHLYQSLFSLFIPQANLESAIKL